MGSSETYSMGFTDTAALLDANVESSEFHIPLPSDGLLWVPCKILSECRNTKFVWVVEPNDLIAPNAALKT